MKTIKIISAILMMASFAFAKPHPKKQDKEPDKPAKVHYKDAKDHERTESMKEAKIAKKKARLNNARYRHEAKERRDFNNM